MVINQCLNQLNDAATELQTKKSKSSIHLQFFTPKYVTSGRTQLRSSATGHRAMQLPMKLRSGGESLATLCSI